MSEQHGIGLSRSGRKVHAITRELEPRTLCAGWVTETTYDETLLGLPEMLRCRTCEQVMTREDHMGEADHE